MIVIGVLILGLAVGLALLVFLGAALVGSHSSGGGVQVVTTIPAYNSPTATP